MKIIQMLVVGMLLSANALGASCDYARWLFPTSEVVTPHSEWFKPNSRGAVKALFITYRGGMREVIELAQRMDLDYTVLTTESPNIFWGDASSRDLPFDRPKMIGDMEQALGGKYDVIVLANINWASLPKRIKYLILKQVKTGTSLVGNINGGDEYWTRANAGKIRMDMPCLLPYKALPAISNYPTMTAVTDKIVETAQFGKGKIHSLRGCNAAGGQSLTPAPSQDSRQIEYDYYLAYICRLLLYAGNKTPVAQISGRDYIRQSRSAGLLLDFTVNSLLKISADCECVVRSEDGDIVANRKERVGLQVGTNTVSMQFAALPAGRYFADMFVRRKGKVIDCGSMCLDLESGVRIDKIELSAQSYGVREPAKGTITIVNETDEAVNVRVIARQRDTLGRITAKKDIAVGAVQAKGRQTAGFELPATMPRSIMQYACVELIDDKTNDIVDKEKQRFSYWNNYPKDDVRLFGWFSPPSGYLDNAFCSVANKAGFDYWTIWNDFENDAGVSDRAKMQFEMGALNNLYIIPYTTRWYDKKTDHYPHPKIPVRTKDDHVRMPCLNDPGYLRREAAILTNMAAAGKPFAPPEFSMGDEDQFVHGPYELCFCSNCVPRFHAYLQTQYGAIDKLNKEYGSAYTSFAQVQPVTLEEVKARPTLGPLWVDYRMCMESVWAGMFKFAAGTIKAVVPNAKIGYEGSDVQINSYGSRSCDNWKMMQAIQWDNPYYWPSISHLVTDFSCPDAMLGIGWYGGYRSQASEIYHRFFPWKSLLMKANLLAVFSVGLEYWDPVMTPDLSFRDSFKAGLKEIHELKNGVGKLLMSVEKENDGIAVLYSVSSVHAATLTGGFPSMENVLNAIVLLMEDSGRQFVMISYEQLKHGILKQKGIRHLILPYAQALSLEEVTAIKSFVHDDGGVVIADIRPGVCDEHAKPYESGALDEIFGVGQDTKSPKALQVGIVIDKEGYPEKYPVAAFADASLKVTTGKSSARSGETPAFIENTYGKGKALLLNFSLSGYATGVGALEGRSMALSKDAEAIRLFWKKTLAGAGAHAGITSNPDIFGVRTYQFKTGGQQYLGILQELPEALMKYEEGTASPLTTNAITFTLPKKAYVYNVRTGGLIGMTDRITADITPGIAQLYSIMPYQTTGLDIQITTEIHQGEELAYKASIKADSREIGLHVFHVEVLAPDGKEVSCYADNIVAVKGETSGVIPLCLNDPCGKWTLKVRDVATGIGSEKVFHVMLK